MVASMGRTKVVDLDVRMVGWSVEKREQTKVEKWVDM